MISVFLRWWFCGPATSRLRVSEAGILWAMIRSTLTYGTVFTTILYLIGGIMRDSIIVGGFAGAIATIFATSGYHLSRIRKEGFK